MESRSKVFGHALHQSMVVLPLGVLIMAVAFDIIGAVLGSADWHRAAFWMIGAGIITGVAAALPGIWDWIAIPMGTRAKTIGLFHGLGNIAVLALFAVAWLARKGSGDPTQTDWIPLTLEIVAFALGGLTAWLGGELVDRLGVGIDRGANLNAPNSLSGKAATETANPVVAPVPAEAK